jgi:hypothetical protein
MINVQRTIIRRLETYGPAMTCAAIVNSLINTIKKDYPDMDEKTTRKRYNSSLSSTLRKMTIKGILKREVGGPRGGFVYSKVETNEQQS